MFAAPFSDPPSPPSHLAASVGVLRAREWTVKSEADKALQPQRWVPSSRCPPPRCTSPSQASFLLHCARSIIFIPLATMGHLLATVGGTKGQWRQEGGDSYNRRWLELQTSHPGFRTMLDCRATRRVHKVDLQAPDYGNDMRLRASALLGCARVADLKSHVHCRAVVHGKDVRHDSLDAAIEVRHW